MQIGLFHKAGDTYRGRLQSLTLDVALVLKPADPGSNERAPDWRIHLDEEGVGIDVGAAWNRQGGKSGHFIAFLLDCPALPRTLHANLMPSHRNEGEHVLLWSSRRRKSSGERPDVRD